MRCNTLKTILVAAVIGAQLVAPARESQGGALIDWLFRREPAAPVFAQPVYAPGAVAAPAVSVGTPCDPCGQVAQPVITNYAPQTCFRTTWVRVPVTNYRPVAAVDPCTSCPVTTLRPCTTYMWQARRVPTYTAFRPLVTACAAPVAAAYAPATCATCAPATTTFAPVVAPAPALGCSSCGVAPAGTPYYTPSAVGAPNVAPRVVVPGTPTPADLQPSLAPTGVTPAAPTIRNFPAYNDPVVPVEDPAVAIPLNSPARMQKKPAEDNRLKFVPDPDAQPAGDEPNRAPRLLTPREKTATKSLRREWASTPIQWSGVRQASADVPVVKEPVKAAPATDVWDDTGWRPLRP
jgi:hypothetical protein